MQFSASFGAYAGMGGSGFGMSMGYSAGFGRGGGMSMGMVAGGMGCAGVPTFGGTAMGDVMGAGMVGMMDTMSALGDISSGLNPMSGMAQFGMGGCGYGFGGGSFSVGMFLGC